ncbi:MAG: tetratricopeptide repeat protein, partial [Anaerolineae bacterium]|nr:tetratricopeptide repeat protein [Anaerolineae bacterium]
KLSDDPAYRLTVMGRALAGLPEWDLAQAAFTQAVEQNPAYAEAWALLGEAMAQNGGDGSAALRRAVEINPDSVLSRALLALNLARRMDWDGAIEHMQAAAHLEPQRAVWRIELGNFHAQQGDVNQAFEEYQIAARIAPRELDVWLALGNFSLIYGFSVEDVGLPAAKRAVEIGEESAAAFNLLGAVQWELGDDVQAEENLKKALELEPSYVRANLNLGNLYLKQGLTNQALEQYAAAVSLDPHGEVGQMAQRMIDRYFSDSQP